MSRRSRDTDDPSSRQPLRVLFAIKSLQVEGGGAERVLTQIAGRLSTRGHRVAILTLDEPDAATFYSLPEDVDRIRLGVGSTGASTPRFQLLRALPLLRRASRAWQPDVVVGFMHSMYLPLGLALINSGVPLVASEHIVAEHYRTRPAQRLLLQATPMVSVRATAISEHVRSSFPSRLARHMVVIPNPVDGLDAAPDADDAKAREALVLSVGTLRAQKDHATLIRAFQHIHAMHPQWRLRIVGEGELRGELEQLVHDLGLSEVVSLPGATRDVEDEYRRAAVFALSSRYESFGLATAEALAHGLPAVGFADCPGTNELIHERVNGLLVEGNARVENLARALDELIRDGGLRRRLAANGPRSVQAYAPERIAMQWEDLLRSVSKGENSRMPEDGVGASSHDDG